ncbi:chorismate synthase [Thermodesulfobacteriota bacterium]
MGIRVRACTVELGGIRAGSIDLDSVDKSPLYCPDIKASEQMEEALSKVKEDEDSLGGIVEVRVEGCPPGLGEPVFDKLDADIAKAIMSVGAVKGVEIGAGFNAAKFKGSENNDQITPDGFKTNQAGGILGGISNGEEIIVRAAIKPIPSIGKEQDTIDRQGRPSKIKTTGRFDVTAIPRVIPVLEAMMKLVLVDHYLRYRAMMGNNSV